MSTQGIEHQTNTSETAQVEDMIETKTVRPREIYSIAFQRIMPVVAVVLKGNFVDQHKVAKFADIADSVALGVREGQD